MPRTLEDFIDPTIPRLSGRDLIIGLSGGKPSQRSTGRPGLAPDKTATIEATVGP